MLPLKVNALPTSGAASVTELPYAIVVAPLAEIVASGNGLFLMITSSVETHDPFVIVQRNVIAVFAGTLVIVDVCNELLVIDALPEEPTKLHKPVPEEGLFPANVNCAVLHND